MAVYSTFFVATPETLLQGFPGWKLPLPQLVKREFTDHWGGKRIIETREPLWDDTNPEAQPEPGMSVIMIQGNYEAYLEARIPAFVRNAPHWCTKGLMNIHLDPLGEMTDGRLALDDALFAHPTLSGNIMVFRPAIVAAIQKAPQQMAKQWAAIMSTPYHTHSVDGSIRLSPDWSVDDALSILRPLADLANQATPNQRLYLLTEW